MNTQYKISIKGLNLHHILEYFQRENIYLYNVVKVNNKKLLCIIKKSDFDKLRKEPLSKLYKIRIEKYYGIKKYINTFVKRTGLVIGVILFFFVTFNMSFRIQQIHFNSENHSCKNNDKCIFSTENEQLLLSYLEKMGIKNNMLINQIPSSQYVSQKLISTFPQISEVSLKRIGTHLYVNILESKLPSSHNTTDLISPVSGIVINTQCSSGKLMVKNGDLVLKDSVLIKHTENPVCGQIVLRTFYHETTIFDENQITYFRTGKKVTSNDLNIFGKEYKSSVSNDFNLYETETKIKYAFLNMLLPIKINQTTYYELKAQKTITSFEEEKNNIYEKLKRITRSHLTVNDKEQNITFTVKQEGSRYRVDCYLESLLTIAI